MKLLIIILTLTTNANAGLMPCNPEMYDRIYVSLVQRALGSKLTAEDFTAKSNAIRSLRQLCRGQISTFETSDGKPKIIKEYAND